MKLVKGFIVGGVLVGALAFAAGYNHGRGAPLLANPLDDYTVEERLRDAAADLAEEAERQLESGQ